MAITETTYRDLLLNRNPMRVASTESLQHAEFRRTGSAIDGCEVVVQYAVYKILLPFIERIRLISGLGTRTRCTRSLSKSSTSLILRKCFNYYGSVGDIVRCIPTTESTESILIWPCVHYIRGDDVADFEGIIDFDREEDAQVACAALNDTR